MRPILFSLICTLSLAWSACGGHNDMPSAPTPINLSGTWTGSFAVEGSAAQMTWTLVQAGGTSLTGSVVVSMSDGTVLLNGALTGTLDGSALTFTIAVGPGAIPALPSCTGQIDGSATATSAASTISGTLTVTASSCPSPLANGSFTLTKTG